MSRRALLLAALLVLCVSAIYICIILKLDNTNIGTTNGLWKSAAIKGWETGAGHEFDNGEWLYGPLYGTLARLIPDRMVAAGTGGAVITVRKMAILNALFGGIASAAVFLLAIRFTSIAGALLIALAHASSAFVILNSVNSEDVIPAYACFTLTVLFLFEYFSLNRFALLFATAVACLLMTLLHWTLMIPCLAAVCALGIWLFRTERRKTWIIPAFLAIFLALAAIVATASRPIGSLKNLLYPVKAQTSKGYLGFAWTKVVYMFIGIGNYFCGGANSGDYYAALHNSTYLSWMVVSWSFTLAALAGVAVALAVPSINRNLRLLAVFGAALFCTGQAEHLYSQPQDPQSQIQPMFVCTIGLTILAERSERTRSRQFQRACGAALAGFVLSIGIYNVRLMFEKQGEDTRYDRAAIALARMFPPSSALVVSHGWEDWNTWMYIETFGGDWDRYRSQAVQLVMVFNDHPGISGDAAAELIVKQITDARNHSHRVVADTLWIGSRENFERSLSTLVDPRTARAYSDRLLATFRAGRQLETPVGPFVELEPAVTARP